MPPFMAVGEKKRKELAGERRIFIASPPRQRRHSDRGAGPFRGTTEAEVGRTRFLARWRHSSAFPRSVRNRRAAQQADGSVRTSTLRYIFIYIWMEEERMKEVERRATSERVRKSPKEASRVSICPSGTTGSPSRSFSRPRAQIISGRCLGDGKL